MTRLWVLPVFLIFCMAIVNVQGTLPYHNVWDMDFITTMDLLQMADGLLPQHINHPGAGLYLLQRWAWPFGRLSASSIGHVVASPIPLLPIAEATVWVRSLTLVPALLTLAGCTWGLVSRLPREKHLFSIALCMVIATFAGFWGFQVEQVRSEMYAIGFYSVAFACLPLLSRPPKFRALMLVFFFAGVGFLTKFQGFFLHAALLLLACDALGKEQLPRLPQRRLVAGILLAVFMICSVISVFSYMPTYFAQFASKKTPNLFFFVSFFSLLLPFVGVALTRVLNASMVLRRPWLYRFTKPGPDLLGYFALPYWAVVGLLAAFVIHFAMGLSLGNSIEYFFFDWRMIFFKVSEHNSLRSSFLTQLSWNLQFHLPLLLVWIAGAVFTWRSLSLPARVTVALYAGLIFASLALASRGRVQDSLWNDVLIVWGLRFFVPSFARVSDWLLWPIAGLLLAWNLTHRYTPSADGVNYHPMAQERFWQEPYESPVNTYTQHMSELRKDPFYFEQANRLALLHAELREITRELWAKPRPNLRHFSMAPPQFRDYVLMTPRQQESTIRPGDMIIWLGAEDLENYTDCPLNPQVVTLEKVRWRQVTEGTKKCRILSTAVRLAFNFARIIDKPTPAE